MLEGGDSPLWWWAIRGIFVLTRDTLGFPDSVPIPPPSLAAKLLDRFPIPKWCYDSPGRKFPNKLQNFIWRSQMTLQVKSKATFYFPSLLASPGQIAVSC